ncbi:hypothetical protein C4D60_Mb02t02640 [Musa balbisiana]|uniref:Receptor-like serine/threonine-protein kinase n=1 Tax=Musa balbisiana TaxID=52838 RepID=A0A4S8I7R1_MUSBA|nr:hypothetical protein C4D60_Mb02t02640 [Musa balbisiana]
MSSSSFLFPFFLVSLLLRCSLSSTTTADPFCNNGYCTANDTQESSRKYSLSASHASAASSYSGDTIVPGEYFYEGQNLISANGKFELGFFNPGDASNAYVGIWYHNITDKTALWVLNNVAPVTISPGYLHLTGDGNLQVCNAADFVIWFTGTPYGNNTIVRLADSGNFLLEDRDSNTTELQSFDYLTDTLIPGMKLGLDKVTNHATKLISWLNATDPYPGAYSCTMETQGTLPEIFITKGQSLRIFRSGPWNGHVFSGIPRMGNISQLKFSFLSNEQEVYFSIDTINNSGLFRAVMDFRGVFQLLEWSATSSGWTSLWAVPQDQCDFYALCGANAVCTETSSVLCQCLQGFVPKSPANWYQNHFSDGCVRQEALSCSSDGFLHLRSVKLPDTVNATADSNMTLNKCSDWCLKNCSCMAYAVTAWSGCLIWRGDLMDLRKFNQGGDQLYVRLLASNIDSAMDNHVKKTVLVITIPTMLSFLLLASTCVVLWRRRVRKQDTIMIKSKQPQTTIGLDYWTGIPAKHADQRAGSMNMMGLLSSFDLSTIKAATNNFSVGNKLGEGGFGIVYKGVLRDGKYIAVKMLSKCSSQGPDEFRNELLLIANLQHRNLVRLLGCCIEGDERILILEYMENKSLDAFIYEKDIDATLLEYLYSIMWLNHMFPKLGQLQWFRFLNAYGVLAFKLWKEDRTLEILDEALDSWTPTLEILECIRVGLLCVQENSEDRPTMAEVVMMLTNEDPQLTSPKEPITLVASSEEEEPSIIQMSVTDEICFDM